MNFSRQTAVVAAARLTNQAATIIAGIIIGHALVRNEAGIVQKGLLVVNMCVLLGMFGIQTFLYTELPKCGANRQRGVFTQSLLVLTAIGAVLAVALLLARAPLTAFLNAPELTALLPWVAAAVFLTLPSGAVEPLLIATGHPWRALAMAIPATALQILVMLWACFIAPSTADALPTAVFAGMILAALTRLVFGAVHAATSVTGAWRTDAPAAALRAMAAFILPVGIVGVLDTLATLLDRNIVAHFYTSSDYALYSYGALEIPLLGLLIGSITPVLLPRFSTLVHEGRPAEMLDLWHRACLKTATVLFAVFMVFMCIAPDFLAILYSENYRASALFMRIYLCLLPVRVIAFMPMLYALGKQNLVLVGAAGDLCFNFCCSLFLVRCTPLGMAGAAVATVLSTTLQAAFYLWVIRRAFAIDLAELLPWRALARTAALCFLCFLPTVAASWFISGWVLIAIAALNAAAYLRFIKFRI